MEQAAVRANNALVVIQQQVILMDGLSNEVAIQRDLAVTAVQEATMALRRLN